MLFVIIRTPVKMREAQIDIYISRAYSLQTSMPTEMTSGPMLSAGIKAIFRRFVITLFCDQDSL